MALTSSLSSLAADGGHAGPPEDRPADLSGPDRRFVDDPGQIHELHVSPHFWTSTSSRDRSGDDNDVLGSTSRYSFVEPTEADCEQQGPDEAVIGLLVRKVGTKTGTCPLSHNADVCAKRRSMRETQMYARNADVCAKRYVPTATYRDHFRPTRVWNWNLIFWFRVDRKWT